MRTSVFSKIILLIALLLFLSFSDGFAQVKSQRSENGMVVSANSLASDVGASILKKGGNAVDAAVATAFALAVTYPAAGNIGGGGFMVIHLADGKNTTIDFRETAPAKSFKNMYLDENGNFNPKLSQEGWTSTGVPGTVAGLLYTLEKYGTMKLAEVIQPAIDLAENGFELDYSSAEYLKGSIGDFLKYESSRKIFTKNGEPFQPGDSLVQKDLANTLKLIRDKGRNGFYSGEVANKFIEESDKNNGCFTKSDLENYKPVEREPLTGDYKGYKIVAMGPPSSGGIIILQALNLTAYYNFSKAEWGSSKYIHTLTEIFKHVFADRAKHMGDSDFYPVPVDFLLSPRYAKIIHDSISDKATPSAEIYPGEPAMLEHEETTHFSVADKFGNAVSTTYTLNGAFGNKIVVDGLGFLLNNEMDDFSAKPGEPNQFGLVGSEANSIQPGKRMLSSMSPTIVLKDEKPFLVIGSPGGSTIPTATLQVLLNVVEFGMGIERAIALPRFHHQWLPDQIDYEKFGMSEDVKNNLISRGQKIGWERGLGLVEGIEIDSAGVFWGASDPRGSGKASGY